MREKDFKNKVSVIITVLNREQDIEELLNSLLLQDYNNYEVIVIDNGSTDNTIQIIKSIIDEKLIYIDGSKFKGSPYSARNLGIKKASGNIIAFIDGTPRVDWISNGVSFIDEHNDIIGGRVKFKCKEGISLYKLYDSIFSLDVKYMIEKHKIAPTANLFIKKKVFDTIGLFEEGIRSGGDIFLTGKAVSNGFKITFNGDAISYYYLRDKDALINKQKRVALGQVNLWKIKNRTVIEKYKTYVKLFVPYNPISFLDAIKRNKPFNISICDIIKLYYIHHKLDRIRLIETLKVVKGM